MRLNNRIRFSPVFHLPVVFSFFISSILFAQDYRPALESGSFDPATVAWYRKPAAKWEEAMPVGNGRIGAMIYGRTDEEIIQLNEETYWSGGPYSTVVRGGHEKLPEIQRLVFNGEMLKAHNLFGRHLMGYPVEQMKYQSLANLHLTFPGSAQATDYARWLDLRTGIAGVSYQVGSVRYLREVFASQPDQVIAIRITADRPGSISFTANLRGVRNQTHSNYGTDYFQMNGRDQNGLVLTGKSTDYLGVEGKLRYEARLEVRNSGGSVKVEDYLLHVQNADEVILYFAAATNFINYQDVSGNPQGRNEKTLKAIEGKTFGSIRDLHLKDIEQLMGRVKLELPATGLTFKPTDERMSKNEGGPDPSLASLCYQFGRYLMVSSSRPGTQPANLQGIWNNDQNPAWDSKYTTNINTEMNYWLAEPANLSECIEPLVTMIRELTDQGAQVAREHYGAKGWVFHQNTDLWRVAAPMDGPTWGTFTTGGAWLVNTAWSHYQYRPDRAFAESFYPVMKGSVMFFLDFLRPHPNGKWLVTNPSTSPENFPSSPGNKRYFDEVTGSYIPGTTICAGSSIDMQILRDLFANFTEAAEVLGQDADMVARVREVRKMLVPPQVGADGSLQEWAEDWGQLEKNHRHFSHLYGLYPGDNFSVNRTPELMPALRAVLEQRGDGGTGWSRSWKMALWARLKDGERAADIFDGYLLEQCYPSLFSKCFTPLQVDGSMGLTAAVSEMLVQSHDGAVELLPALPKSWNSGHFEGVRVRGGFQLSLKWNAGKVSELKVIADQAGEFQLRTGGSELFLNNRKIKSNGTGTAIIKMKKGEEQIILFR